MSGDTGNLGAANSLKNQVNHTSSTQHTLVAPVAIDSTPAMGDAIFDWSIALGIIVVVVFYATSFLFFKEKDSE